MDNRARAINYVRQNYDRQLAASVPSNDQDDPVVTKATVGNLVIKMVDHASEPSVYEKIGIRDLLTKRQWRRMRHKRSKSQEALS